ncbi:hypothetical protein [Salinicola acroporae]|uniref:Uncharacterized protein n=1 Tax=Salinicola acroporae TaxID=1541440 RepID=A0ABT6I291_9GAMM|nr:hypothetical protein [Salinicola acroporae]MDH4571789.1 hypothetical protein [Salinicola acroporae]
MKITGRQVDPDRYRSPGTGPAPVRPAEAPARRDDDFLRAVGHARARDADQPTLAARLDALERPEASDARSYANARSIELLQHVIEGVLPTLEAEDDIVGMAREVIGEELEWRQAWEARMNEAMAPQAGAAPGSDDADDEEPS